jgi:hypothetical protein
MIKSRRMRLAGNLVRMGRREARDFGGKARQEGHKEDLNILVGKPDKKATRKT